MTIETTHFPPPAGHQVMERFFPDLIWQIDDIARSFRRQYGDDSPHIVSNEELDNNKLLNKILDKSLRNLIKKRVPQQNAVDDVNILFHHLRYMVNFSLHRRKTFWIEESLAWMFQQTQLDIEGDCLKLPFPSCMYIFTDVNSLELATRTMQSDPDCFLKEESVKVLTCYLSQKYQGDESSELEVNMVFDTRSDEWPYLLNRILNIGIDDNLETILDSHCSDVDPTKRDEIYTNPNMKKLLHLIISSVLYSTSAQINMQFIESPLSSLKNRMTVNPKGKLKQQYNELKKTYSMDDIIYLPGTIDITQYKMLHNLHKTKKGQSLSHRFLVRGHWRRPNPDWKDQKLRWIMPFWKGPEGSLIIEKEYKLKP